MNHSINIAAIQQFGDANRDICLQTCIHHIEQAAKKGAELILLQELQSGLYFCQGEDSGRFNLAETIPGPTTDALTVCARNNKVVIVATIFERRSAGVFHNTAIVIEKDGKIAGKYRKMHLPHDPGFNEKYYFAPGDLGFTPIQCSLGKLGVLICWDQWFPEAARLMALAGAEILLYPTSIGWVAEDSKVEQLQQRDAWITIQRSHAIANHLPVVVCNRVGLEKLNSNDEGINFWGSSFITDAHGKILTQAKEDQEQIIIAKIEKSDTERLRRMWPYLRDRRIDAYHGLLELEIRK